MAGSTPSGRRSRRRSGKRPSSPLAQNNPLGKRRRELSRQPKSTTNASQGPFTGSPPRPSQEVSGSRPRRQPSARSPQNPPSAHFQTDAETNRISPNSRMIQPSQSIGQRGSKRHDRNAPPVLPSQLKGQPKSPRPFNGNTSRPLEETSQPIHPQPSAYLDPVNTYYTTPYPGQMTGDPSHQVLNQPPTLLQQQKQAQEQRHVRQSSLGPLLGQGSPSTPPVQDPSSRQSSNNSPYEAYGASQHMYPQAPSGGAARNTRDIRLGPDIRRRPQLSSNPAFGRTRSVPRPGGGVGIPSVQSPPYSVYPPSQNGTQLQAHPSVDGLPMERVDAQGPGLASLAQPRTQRLQPRPVARRSETRRARRGDKRARTRPPRTPMISTAAAIPLQSSNAHSPKKAVSPLVYGVRLLILGVGLGAIAGTLISALDPARISGRTVVGNGLIPAETSITDPVESNGGGDGASDSQTAGASSSLSVQQSAPSATIISLNAIPKRSPYTALANQLQTMANTQPELTPGVFALDLDTYNYVDLNGSTTFSAASIIKVPILVAFFQDVEQNKIRLDDILVMEEGDVAGGSGNMRMGTIGDQYSALETAKKMIVISDNTATNMLIRRLGGIDQLNRRFRAWGLTATALRNPLPDLEGTNTTSPSEMTHLMTLLSQGKLLETQSRDRMFDIMYQTETATLLPAGIGGNADIAHKTGDIGSMVGDTGVVDTSSGKRYAITIMMRRPHNDSRAQELIRKMAGVIHRELQTPSTPAVPSAAQTRSVSRSSDSSTGNNRNSTDPNTPDSLEANEERASDQ